MCWPDYRATICNLHDHYCWTSWICVCVCVRCFLRLQLPAQQFTMHLLLEQTWSRLDLGATLSGNAAGTVLSCTISWSLWSSVRVLARANHRCMSKRIRYGLLTDLQLKCRAKSTSQGASPPRLPARPLAPLAQGNPGGHVAKVHAQLRRITGYGYLPERRKVDHAHF